MPDDDEDLRELLLRDGDLDLDTIGGGSNLTAYLGATEPEGAVWGAGAPGPTFYDPASEAWDDVGWWAVRYYPNAIEWVLGIGAVGEGEGPPIDFYAEASYRSFNMQSVAHPDQIAFIVEVQAGTHMAFVRAADGQTDPVFTVQDDDGNAAFRVGPTGSLGVFGKVPPSQSVAGTTAADAIACLKAYGFMAT